MKSPGPAKSRSAGLAFAATRFCSASLMSGLRTVTDSLAHDLRSPLTRLRGALALALSLSLPDNLPRRDLIVVITFAVVAFSVFAQGLTITPLLRRLGQIKSGVG